MTYDLEFIRQHAEAYEGSRSTDVTLVLDMVQQLLDTDNFVIVQESINDVRAKEDAEADSDETPRKRRRGNPKFDGSTQVVLKRIAPEMHNGRKVQMDLDILGYVFADGTYDFKFNRMDERHFRLALDGHIDVEPTDMEMHLCMVDILPEKMWNIKEASFDSRDQFVGAALSDAYNLDESNPYAYMALKQVCFNMFEALREGDESSTETYERIMGLTPSSPSTD